jgi:hypothetical protein
MYRIFASAMLSILLFSTTPAWAVTVSGGFVTTSVVNDFSAQYNLTGSNFSMVCSSPTGLCGHYNYTPTTPFAVVAPLGTSTSLDSRFIIEPGGPPGQLILDGTTYRARGTFDFTVGSVIRQPSVTAPFTFTGQLDLLHPETLHDLGDLHLNGQGNVTATFDNFTARSLMFNFTAAPLNGGGGSGVPPIPEPSTMLLFASGLAGMRFWRRRSTEE